MFKVNMTIFTCPGGSKSVLHNSYQTHNSLGGHIEKKSYVIGSMLVMWKCLGYPATSVHADDMFRKKTADQIWK